MMGLKSKLFLFFVTIVFFTSEIKADQQESAGPKTGAVHYTTTTSGTDLDSNGYTVYLRGSGNNYMKSISDTASVTFGSLNSGEYDIHIEGVAYNCAVEEDTPRAITVNNTDTTQVNFTINCKEQWLDGKIVFTSNRAEVSKNIVHTINPDGTEPRRLMGESRNEFVPFWSPNGSRIGFTFKYSGGYEMKGPHNIGHHHEVDKRNLEVFTVKSDGSDLRRVTQNDALDGGTSWSPDGKRIVFESNRDGNYEIYTIQTDGTALKRITNHSAADRQADWSPDGSHIVFESSRNSNTDVYTIKSDGSDLQRVTTDASFDGDPAWSPDGNRIVFTTERNGHKQIYTIKPDGGDLQQVTATSEKAWAPDWSPDGSRIVFTYEGWYAYSANEIYMIKPDGTDMRRITDNNLYDDSNPSWSR